MAEDWNAQRVTSYFIIDHYLSDISEVEQTLKNGDIGIKQSARTVQVLTDCKPNRIYYVNCLFLFLIRIFAQFHQYTARGFWRRHGP